MSANGKYANMLMPGEELSFTLRPHWRFIVAGLTIGIVVIVAWWKWAALWTEWLGSNASIPKLAGAVIAGFFILKYTAKPLVEWLVTRYIFTSYRVMARSGVITRRAADIPLEKVSNVYYEQTLLDRLLGCGSLIIDSSGGDGFTIKDVPSVERVTRDLHVLVEGGRPAGRNGPAVTPKLRQDNPGDDSATDSGLPGAEHGDWF